MARKKTAAQSRSPLMKLPAELRLWIYELTLGGNTFHVGRPAAHCRPLRHLSLNAPVGLCHYAVTDREHRTQRRHARQSGDRSSPQPLREDNTSVFEAHVISCGAQRTRPYGRRIFSILSLCRQIHHEARLVPLSSNKFTFINPAALHNFLQRLTEEQKHAITSIALYEVDSTRKWQQVLPEATIAALSGLQTLSLTVNLEKEDCRGIFFFKCRPGLSASEVRKRLFSGVKALAQSNLRSLIVLVDETAAARYWWHGKHPLAIELPSTEDIKQWEEEIKQSLLT